MIRKNIDNIRDFIKEKHLVSIPQLQQEFQLRYYDVYQIIVQLSRENIVQFVGGILYEYIEPCVKTKMQVGGFQCNKHSSFSDESPLFNCNRSEDDLFDLNKSCVDKDIDSEKPYCSEHICEDYSIWASYGEFMAAVRVALRRILISNEPIDIAINKAEALLSEAKLNNNLRLIQVYNRVLLRLKSIT